MKPRSILDIFYTDAKQTFPFKVRKAATVVDECKDQGQESAVGRVVEIISRAENPGELVSWAIRNEQMRRIDTAVYEFVSGAPQVTEVGRGDALWVAFDNSPEPGYFQVTVLDDLYGSSAIGRSVLSARAMAYEILAAKLRDKDRDERALTPVVKWEPK